MKSWLPNRPSKVVCIIGFEVFNIVKILVRYIRIIIVLNICNRQKLINA